MSQLDIVVVLFRQKIRGTIKQQEDLFNDERAEIN